MFINRTVEKVPDDVAVAGGAVVVRIGVRSAEHIRYRETLDTFVTTVVKRRSFV